MPKTIARPSPVPLPGPLVVKNGSKMRAFVASSMPVPGVADRQEDVLAGADAGVRAGVPLVQRDVLRLDGQAAAGRHGVAGVDAQVE